MAALTKLSDESEVLYTDLLKIAQESEEGLKKVFFQGDLQTIAADSAKSVNSLMILIQELTGHSLLRTSKLQGSLCWSTRPRDAAKNISMLNENEKLVYTYVEDAHQKGIWIKDIKKRSNVHPETVEKAIKKLESTRLIKSVKNVRSPVQKTYMLSHLAPSDDVTGGSFYDGGDLDESLIEELSNLIVFHVRMQSWVDAKVKRMKRESSPIVVDDDELADASKKRKRGGNSGDIEDAVPPPTHRKHRRSSRHDPETDTPLYHTVQLAYPAYSRSYPSAEMIHQFITTTDAIRATKALQLTVAEIQNVIDVLVWDDKLEKVGDGYRTVRGVNFRPSGVEADDDDDDDDEEGEESEPWWKGNGLTQVPCGRCPVFDLCGEGGPINAGNCEYFKAWLGTND